MNIKTLLLSSILAFSATTVVPSEQAINTAASNWLTETVFPGAIVGGLTGASISYMAGTAIDIIINNRIISYIDDILYDSDLYHFRKSLTAVIMLTRVAAQIGAKQYWEKPLRNKLMNWLNNYCGNDLSATGTLGGETTLVDEKAEARKTWARLAAWFGTMTQFKSE